MQNSKRWLYLVILLVIVVVVLILILKPFGCETPEEEEGEVVNDEQVVDEEEKVELIYSLGEWEEIISLTYSPDGEIIAVGASEVELYSVTEGEVIRSGKDLEENRPSSRSLSFSPDGSILAAAWRGAGLYNAEDLTMLTHLHGGNECRIAFSPDGKTVATHPAQASGEVWLWQAENGKDFEKVAEFNPEGGMIHAIEFTPDGKYLAGGFRDGKVRFWEVESRELAGTIDFNSSGGNYNLTFSPDGKTLAASEPDLGSEIYLFNLEDGTRKRELDPEGRVSRMEISPDGTMLAYGKFDGTVEILDTEDWSLFYSLDHNDTIRGLSFSPDSKYLAVGTGEGELFHYQINKP